MTRQHSILFLAIMFFYVLFTAQSANSQEVTPRHRVEYGVFVQGGFPPDYKIHFDEITGNTKAINTENIELEMYEAGIYAGISTPRFDHAAFLKGRGEIISEVIPFWLARYPSQTVTWTFQSGNNPPYIVESRYWKAQNFHGASVTPVILRWNFSQRDQQKVKPWLQVGCGVLWTNNKFPIGFLQNTSVFNFTPQVGGGVNIFRNPKHSVNAGFKFIHISNGGLGDHNPAIHDSLNFSLGYSWWK